MKNTEILYIAPQHNSDALSSTIRLAGYNVYVTSDFIKARELLNEQNFHVGLVQLELFSGESLQHIMGGLIDLGRDMEWIALLSPITMENGDICQVIAERFYDYHTLPVDVNRLLNTIGHICGMATVKNRAFQQENVDFSQYGIAGVHPTMKHVYQSLAKIVRVDMPVLITGESGTGKELAALAIHNYSARSKGAFIAVNCGALPTNLIQSELFGYEKGAFTGAHQRKIGFIERAAGGVLLLDEIGDLSLDLQVNLLRFIQHNTIYRIGGHVEIPIDVRIISATHIDLEKAIQEGRFREDLYFRLSALQIEMPPLRQRGQDIELLTHFFFNNFRNENNCNIRGFSHQALRAIRSYNWPGNIRELKNRVHRAMVMCETRLITPANLGLKEYQAKPYPVNLREAKEKMEKEIIQNALEQEGNCVVSAASTLGISHVTLYRLVKKYGIMAKGDPLLSMP